MGLLSTKDYIALEDANITSRVRLTTENAKQFGKLSALVHLLRIEIPIAEISGHKKITEIQELVDEIFEDLNSVKNV